MSDKQALASKEEDLQALARLVLESTEVAEALVKAIQATCDTLLRRLDEPVIPGLQGSLDEILEVMRAEKQPPRLNMPWLMSIALGLVLVSGGLGWYVGYTPAAIRQRANLMEQVNAVLVERQQTLPPEVKSKLATIYTQQGFAPVEKQRGGKP
jgi:hypothetical protein